MEELSGIEGTTFPSIGMVVNVDTDFYTDNLVTETSSLMMTTLMDNSSFITDRYPVRDPLYVVIPITVLYSIIFFTGVVGNIVTCIVISRNKHMHTATNYYLFSLAVSDLLLLVSGLPQEMYFIWSRYPYVFGEAFCVLRGLAAETSANATVLTITAFTVERYVAICHPFLSHTMSKLSRAVKLVLAIWVVALAFAIPQAIQFGLINVENPDMVSCYVKREIMKHSFEVSTFLFFVAPMTLITVLYALIGLRLRRSNLMKKESGSFCNSKNQPTAANSGRHHQSQSSRRVLKMLVAVVVAFFICWAPFHVQRLVYIYGIEDNRPIIRTIYGIVTYISGILYYVSTTINPILYQIMSLKFREAFKDTIARCCGFRSLKNSRARRTYSILSRSAQRTMGASGGTNQDSTDYSGNSVRDESIQAGCRSGLNHTTSTDTISRLHTPRKTHGDCLSNDCITPNDDTDSRNYHRSFSVVLSTIQGNEATVRTTVVPTFSRQSTQSSQKSFLSSSTNVDEEKKFRKRDNYNLWKVLNCIKNSNSNASSGNEPQLPMTYCPQVVVQDISLVPSGETFTMLPVSASDNSLSNVSNSSLRDAEDELTSYMQELQRREQC